jgi:putative flippase GtrA
MSRADREVALQLGKFLIVGGTGVVVNNLALYVFVQWLLWPLLAASTVATGLAIGNNFVLNDFWTFDRRQAPGPLQRLMRFSLVSLSGFCITTITLWSLVTYLSIHYLVANIIGIALASCSNFIANATWTWSGSAEQ